MRYLLIIIILASLIGCNAWKQSLVSEGNQMDVVQNSILDFSNTSKLYKQDSIFLVSFEDTLYRKELEKVDSLNHNWIPDKRLRNIVALNITASINKINYSQDIEIGSFGQLPSRFIEKENKLFIWWDDKYPLSKEAVDVFKEYNLVKKVESDYITELILDVGKKGVDYYFCKNNLRKYTKVINNSSLGYYEVPKLNCTE